VSSAARRDKPLHLGLTLVGFAGVAGVFLPFTYDYSPLRAVGESDLWKLGAPFFLSVFVAIASLRWITSGRFSRAERVASYTLSVLTAGVILWMWVEVIGPRPRIDDWGFILIPPVTFLTAVFLVIVGSINGGARGFSPVAALQVPYLGNCLLLLIEFARHWQLGAWFSLITASAYVLQIFLIRARPGALLGEVAASGIE